MNKLANVRASHPLRLPIGIMATGALLTALLTAYLCGYLPIDEPPARSLMRLVFAIALLCSLLMFATGLSLLRWPNNGKHSSEGG